MIFSYQSIKQQMCFSKSECISLEVFKVCTTKFYKKTYKMLKNLNICNSNKIINKQYLNIE